MFVIGYIFIALEHQTGINKTAIALLLGILLWVMYIFSGPQIIVGADPAAFQNFIHQHPAYEHLSPLAQVREYILNWEIIDHLGNISEILFYLIGALTIVETIDVHQGFDGITRSVKTKNKKKLLWLVAFITFFMSSVLDNMTSAIVGTTRTLDFRQYHHYCSQCRGSLDPDRGCHHNHALDQR